MTQRYWTIVPLLLTPALAFANDTKISGIIDARASSTDSFNSWVDGGWGKYRYSDGSEFSIAQAAITLDKEWDALSLHITANSVIDDSETEVGLTEFWLKYKTLPNQNGYRYSLRAGFMYPEISVENKGTAWSSPYTLSWSGINSWIGEELRHIGLEFNVERLGKFHNSEHDFKFSTSVFGNNDTTGAMLAWHGWTNSSRQTLWRKSIPVPWRKAQAPGNHLEVQARNSDPFDEIDDKLGIEMHGSWKWKGVGVFSVGRYDNMANPYIEVNGQYAWRTKFWHASANMNLPGRVKLLAQYMNGDTLMQSPQRTDVVNNNFYSAFILLSRRWAQHRFTARFEDFSITDLDNTPGDANDEEGYAVTLNYQYRFNKNLFLHIEHNWRDTDRKESAYRPGGESVTEKQWQLAARYYW